MATTTNYGWTTPDDTALVKDGASAIRTLGSSVDTTTKNLNPETTLGDLSFRSSTSNVNTRIPIGSSGQHLTVVAGVPAWSTASDQTPLTTKGDLFTFSTVDARLGVGANGTTLVADSAEATGLKWATPAAGGMTLLNSGNTALSGSTITFSSLGGYETLLVNIFGLNPSSATAIGSMRFNSDTGSNYSQSEFSYSPGVGENTAGQNTTAITLSRFGRSYLNQNTTNYWNFEIFDYNRASTRVIRYNIIETGVTLTQGTARYGGSADITSLTLLVDTGTFSGGTCEIWGIK